MSIFEHKDNRIIRTFTLVGLVLIWLAFVFGEAYGSSKSAGSVSFIKIKKATSTDINNYSGKKVIWKGTLKELVSNEAYFDYVFKLSSGDEVRVLSGRGLKYKEGDYLKLRGFIMVKDGRFSHLVLTKAEQISKGPGDYYDIPGLIPLNASDEVIFNRIYSWILYYNRGISRRNARFIANRIVYYSRRQKTDPFLVTAVISAESAFNVNAVSVAGAIGLGQLMPGTAAALGVNARDPEQNIRGAVRYLKAQLNRWERSTAPVAYALASYNAGPGAVEKYSGIPPYRETIDYVNIVSSLYYQIRKKGGGS